MDIFNFDWFEFETPACGAVGKDIVTVVGGPGFDSWASQIEHCVANDSPPLQCFFGAVLARRQAAEMDPATRYIRRNTGRITKI